MEFITGNQQFNQSSWRFSKHPMSLRSARLTIATGIVLHGGSKAFGGRRVDAIMSRANVRFGSKADICAAKRHVRFALTCAAQLGVSAKGQ